MALQSTAREHIPSHKYLLFAVFPVLVSVIGSIKAELIRQSTRSAEPPLRQESSVLGIIIFGQGQPSSRLSVVTGHRNRGQIMSNNPLYPLVGKYIYSPKTGERVFITPLVFKDYVDLICWFIASGNGHISTSGIDKACDCPGIKELYTPSVQSLAKRLGVQSADDLNDCTII